MNLTYRVAYARIQYFDENFIALDTIQKDVSQNEGSPQFFNHVRLRAHIAI